MTATTGKIRITHLQHMATACLLVCLWGCAQQRPPILTETDVPSAWHADERHAPVPDHWLASFNAPFLTPIVDLALADNYLLQQQALQVNIAQERVGIVRADRLPTLSVSLSGERFRPLGNFANIDEQISISANIRFEVDLWGKLSDAQREAELNLAAEQMRYLDAERRLVAQVVSSTFDVISAERLQAVFDQRFDNLEQGVDIIDRGYRSGLNEALDVYLAQNTMEQERANVANQRQVRFEAATSLQLLVAEYPDARYPLEQPLPELAALPNIGIPSALLKRRPDIQQAWLDLLATDAALAVAHKNRFPSLDLIGSLRDSASGFNGLLDGQDYAFSALANLFQPVFEGGRLSAEEQQARLRVEQAEQRYLEVVYAAFAEVENELSRAVSLQERYDAFLKAEANAATALTLSFDEYQRGLVDFTTVLESQRRAFDSQTAVVQLGNELLQSRVALLLALGGDF